jgi:undecaprenyl-diphosphatase
MSIMRSERLWRRAGEIDLSLCVLFNRGVRRRAVQRLFAVISRLGNGVFWYALMAVLPLTFGTEGMISAGHMAVVGAVGVLLYRLMKGRINRERPFVHHPQIRLGAMPLDRFSFPSGHTLHAVAFTIVAVAYHPSLAVVLVPFALLVAASRMVLGLHYPSDVAMGAMVGAGLAVGSFLLI